MPKQKQRCRHCGADGHNIDTCRLYRMATKELQAEATRRYTLTITHKEQESSSRKPHKKKSVKSMQRN